MAKPDGRVGLAGSIFRGVTKIDRLLLPTVHDLLGHRREGGQIVQVLGHCA